MNNKSIGQKVSDVIVDDIDYLEGRWQEEKEYEDFQDYKNRMKQALANKEVKKILKSKRAKFISMTKRPFCLKYSIEGIDVISSITVNAKGITYREKANV